MPKARVYIDANILKLSATRLLRFRPREVIVDWGGTRQPLTVHDPVTVNPNVGIANNPELKREAELLPQVAALADSGIVDFLINIETQMEVWGLPNLDSGTGSFYGAPHTLIEAPVHTVDSCLAATTTTDQSPESPSFSAAQSREPGRRLGNTPARLGRMHRQTQAQLDALDEELQTTQDFFDKSFGGPLVS